MVMSDSSRIKPSVHLRFSDNYLRAHVWDFLKYSTHAQFVCIEEEFETALKFSPYWIREEKRSDDTRLEDDISFTEKKIIFGRTLNNYLEPSLRLSNYNIKSLTESIKHHLSGLFYFYIKKNNSKYSSLIVDFLLDFAGNLNLLGIVPQARDQKRSTQIFVYSDIISDFPEVTSQLKQMRFDLKDFFFQVRIDLDEDGSITIESFVLNEVNDFDLYGLSGVNIPLISVMNLLHVKTITSRMVDHAHIRYSHPNVRGYILDYNTIYVDLDETLIWKNKMIKTVYDLINNEYKKGIVLILLTRHEKQIEDTLKITGIDIGIFEEVIKVEKHELKSAYILNSSSLFLDNEHRQRADIRSNCELPVLDLFQIKYLS